MVVVLLVATLTAVCTYIFRIYVARNYTVAEYGLFYSTLAFFSLVLVVVDLGLFQAQVRHISELRAKSNDSEIKSVLFTSLVFQTCIALFLSIVMYFLSDLITIHFFHVSNTLLFNFLLIWFLTYPMYYFVGVYTLSYEKTTWWSFFELIRILFMLVVAISLSCFKIGILSVLIAYALVNIFIFILLLLLKRRFFIKKNFKIKFGSIYPNTIKYGLFVGVGGFAWIALTQMDTLMVTYFLGLTSVGLYQVAVPIATILTTIIGTISGVLLSKASNLFANNKKEELSSLFLLIQKYILLFVLPLTLMLMLFSNLVISLLFSEKYLAAKNVLSILSFAYLFSAMSVIMFYLLVAIGHAKKASKTFILGAIINIVLIYVFMMKFGLDGVAIAVLITHLIVFTVLSIYTYRLLTHKFQVMIWIKAIISSIMFGLSIFIVKAILHLNYIIETVLCIAIASTIYLLCCYFLGLISWKELDFLKNIRKK